MSLWQGKGGSLREREGRRQRSKADGKAKKGVAMQSQWRDSDERQRQKCLVAMAWQCDDDGCYCHRVHDLGLLQWFELNFKVDFGLQLGNEGRKKYSFSSQIYDPKALIPSWRTKMEGMRGINFFSFNL